MANNKILVVDDDPNIAQLINVYLTREGHRLDGVAFFSGIGLPRGAPALAGGGHQPVIRQNVRPRPVSYTHLDVYQRQLMGWSIQRPALPVSKRTTRRSQST